MNKLGGIDPSSSSQMERAKEYDLITLPSDVEGANCGNCKYFTQGYCINPKIQQPVTERQCCSLWDKVGSIRPWFKSKLDYLKKLIP